MDNGTNIMQLASGYFDYMARNFPVMCTSDEFYFFPRAKKAMDFANTLDSLDKEKIKENISYVKNLKRKLELLWASSKNITQDLESQIDLSLLRQSISSFLMQFEEQKIWQYDPTLYLKIILFGKKEALRKTPRLLAEAGRNLKKAPLPNLSLSKELIPVCIDYLRSIKPKFQSKDAINSLIDFKKILEKLPIQKNISVDRTLLQKILRDCFSYKRTLEEIFEIALKEYKLTVRELEKGAKKIDRKKTWQEILKNFNIDIKSPSTLLKLYQGQIKKIKLFLEAKNAVSIPETKKVIVAPTPKYIVPLRASASYSAPSHFYITSQKAINNEYIFVTAHETYPGHHLLDSVRRSLKNPIRSQIESPFFYEGWASYAERLIEQLGYIKDPRQRLVGLKRQAWRTVRTMLDVGIRTNRLKPKDAKALLKNLGYPQKIVKSMVRHYMLTPGYQLCYTIGKFEIEQLKKKFAEKLGLKKFHDSLLESGEAPFSLLDKHLEDICKKNS